MASVFQHILFWVVGLIVGSFLNVCIYRIPRKISLWLPGSFCPHCHVHIPFYFNIPIISYVYLKGRCHACNQLISWRYPLVEFLTGLLTWLAYLRFGPGSELLFYLLLIYFLIVISFIDLSTQLIHNRLLIGLFSAGVVSNFVLKVVSFPEAILGFFTGGLLMLLFALLGYGLFRKESLGMGDVKLVAVAGFFLGWKAIVISVFVGFFLAFLGFVFLLWARKVTREDYLPMGPFLALAFVVFLFWGSHLIQWYWQWIFWVGK